MERLPEYKYSADLAKKLRADSGKSLAEIAEILGIEKRIWQLIEQQKVKIHVSKIKKLCTAADLNPDEYLTLAREGEKLLKNSQHEEDSSGPDVSDMKLYRSIFGWTLDEAQEYFDISRLPLVRVESGQILEGSRIRFDDLRARYQEALVRARQQAKSLFDQFKAGESNFVIESGEWFVIPVFENTETLQNFYPALRIAGGTAAYYRYVAGQLLTMMLEAGRNTRLFLFEDSNLSLPIFKNNCSFSSLKDYMKKLKWS